MGDLRKFVVLRRLVHATVLLGRVCLITDAASGAQAQETKVMIDNFTFSPNQITVVTGTRVIWTNRDDIPHTVTDSTEPRAIKSAALDTGDSFGFTFDKPGTYSYFCSLHPHMQGSVVVR